MYRVLYCEGNTDGTVGGSHRGLELLVSSLNRSRFSPVVVFYQENLHAASLRGKRFDVRIWNPLLGLRTPSSRKPPTIAQRVRWYVFDFLIEALRQAWFLKKEKIDIVHLNNSIGTNHSWVLACVLARVICVSHERNLSYNYDRISKSLTRFPARIVCMSEAIRKALHPQVCHPDRLVVVYDGVEMDQMLATRSREEIRRKFQISDGAALLCMPGNIKEWKGQHIVIEALKIVAESAYPFVCIFAGTHLGDSDPYFAGLKKLVLDYKLSDHVKFIGFHEDINSIYAASDMVIHASILPEPFGRVAMEPMVFGKPVIGTDAGGIPEIVADGETGFVYAPGNSAELASKIIRLLSDQDLARTLGEAAKKRVTDQFDSTATTDQIERLYQTLLPSEP